MKTDLSSKVAHIVFGSCGLLTAIITLYFVAFIFYMAYPVLSSQGLYFIFGDIWNYSQGIYGIKIYILGTLAVTLLTLMIAVPLGIFTAIFLAEFASAKVAGFIRPLIELLVGIPSVVYGIFGFVVLSGFIKEYLKPFLSHYLGFIPIFYDPNPSLGDGVLLASLVLAVMILPTIVTISENSIRSVPHVYREASFAIGATHWETIKKVVIPASSGGIIASVILGTMRAMGETMAIVMLLGNSAVIPTSIFSIGYAMTSKILNDAGENIATPEYRSALFAIAAVLFMIEILLVAAARKIGGRQ